MCIYEVDKYLLLSVSLQTLCEWGGWRLDLQKTTSNTHSHTTPLHTHHTLTITLSPSHPHHHTLTITLTITPSPSHPHHHTLTSEYGGSWVREIKDLVPVSSHPHGPLSCSPSHLLRIALLTEQCTNKGPDTCTSNHINGNPYTEVEDVRWLLKNWDLSL